MIWTLLIIGAVIGSNNLAASLTIGTLGSKRVWRIIFIFGVFEFVMPLIGMWIGERFSSAIGEFGSILSVVVLLSLAGLSFYAATKPPRTDKKLADKLTTVKGLILLELGLSMDNLVAGFGIGVRPGELPPLILALVIAIFSITYTFFGLKFGNKLAVKWQNKAEFFTGTLLTLLAMLSWFEVI